MLERVQRRYPEARFAVMCADWQISRTTDWLTAERFWRKHAERVGPRSGPSTVMWHTDSSRYQGQDLLDWLQALRDLPELQKADLVVSDNLASVLELRHDAVLLGSFLWSDVFSSAHPGLPAVERFARHEKALLKRFQPPMICVAEAAMPAVLELTRPLQVGWMPENLDGHNLLAERDAVAVLGGATGAAGKILEAAVGTLLDLGTQNVLIDPPIRDALPPIWRSSTAPFLHSSEDFGRCRVVVCRPGMGTLNECIGHRIPVLSTYELNNPEMAHLARKVEELGIGIDIGPGRPTRKKLSEALQMLEAEPAAAKRRDRYCALNRNGLEEGAEYLCSRLEMAAGERN
ncbi:MAG: hypothetical protein IT186_07105 [Acidobacteria bacterium]|nr:hypothetical protein [Acidobacteriota bacterium]